MVDFFCRFRCTVWTACDSWKLGARLSVMQSRAVMGHVFHRPKWASRPRYPSLAGTRADPSPLCSIRKPRWDLYELRANLIDDCQLRLTPWNQVWYTHFHMRASILICFLSWVSPINLALRKGGDYYETLMSRILRRESIRSISVPLILFSKFLMIWTILTHRIWGYFRWRTMVSANITRSDEHEAMQIFHKVGTPPSQP